jgi:hypothetical protein
MGGEWENEMGTTSMFACLIRSSMFMFVIWTNMYVYDIET